VASTDPDPNALASVLLHLLYFSKYLYVCSKVDKVARDVTLSFYTTLWTTYVFWDEDDDDDDGDVPLGFDAVLTRK
jgi:hypothetical protein